MTITGGLWLIDHVNLCKLGGQTPRPNLISIVDVFTIFHHPYPQQFASPHLPAVWKVTNPKIISGWSLWLPFQRGSWKVGRLELLGTMATPLLVSHLGRWPSFHRGHRGGLQHHLQPALRRAPLGPSTETAGRFRAMFFLWRAVDGRNP